MFINNKKFIIGLFGLTIVGGVILSNSRKHNENISEQEVIQFSQDFNKNLPVKVTKDITLIKSQIGSVSKNIYTLDFFYAYYVNKNDVKNFNTLTNNIIYQTCQNEVILSLLKRNLLIKHQFITLDKEKLPYIGVSILDCQPEKATENNNKK